MAQLPKIDSEGLRLAKRISAERVLSVTRVSKRSSQTDKQRIRTLELRVAALEKKAAELFKLAERVDRVERDTSPHALAGYLP